MSHFGDTHHSPLIGNDITDLHLEYTVSAPPQALLSCGGTPAGTNTAPMNIVGPDAPDTRSWSALATAEPGQPVFPAVARTVLSAKVAGEPSQAETVGGVRREPSGSFRRGCYSAASGASAASCASCTDNRPAAEAAQHGVAATPASRCRGGGRSALAIGGMGLEMACMWRGERYKRQLCAMGARRWGDGSARCKGGDSTHRSADGRYH